MNSSLINHLFLKTTYQKQQKETLTFCMKISLTIATILFGLCCIFQVTSGNSLTNRSTHIQHKFLFLQISSLIFKRLLLYRKTHCVFLYFLSHFKYFSYWMCDFFSHNNQFSNTSWVSSNNSLLTLLELMQTPEVKGSIQQDWTPLQVPAKGPGFQKVQAVTLTDQL